MRDNKDVSAIGLAARGMAMGIAEVIPGVSGGTIAFITGIYETLIESIKAIDIGLIKNFFTGKWSTVFEQINGKFLLFLFCGMALGVVAGTFVITYLLEQYPEPLWGFFFGLIIASGIYIARQVTHWNIKYSLLFFVALAISFAITLIVPAHGSESLIFVFLSGCIAICALILPGVSGSFILLLLGMYGIIIPNLKALLTDFNTSSLMMLVVFGLGCLVGLAGFSRILSHAFKHYKNGTLAILTGLMVGSLNKIWPWRNPMKAYNKDTQSYFDVDLTQVASYDMNIIKWVKEANVLPSSYYSEPSTWLTISLLIIGLVSVFFLDRVNADKS